MNKKDLVFAAALGLFVENGFHGTATGKIAQEAGVANGTLFNYFKTKDELVIALYIKLKEELGGFIQKNTADKTGIKEVMKAQFLSSLSWAVSNSIKFRYIQQFHSSPYIAQVDPEILRQQELPHISLIQKGIKEKIIKALPVDFIYALLSSHTIGLYQYVISKKMSKAKQQDTLLNGFEMLWDMIT